MAVRSMPLLANAIPSDVHSASFVWKTGAKCSRNGQR